MAAFQIVGVLNITPDSYHDGGKYISVDRALARAEEMMKQGADIIEIGGESTGPHSKDVPEEEEADRVLPVLRAIRKAHPEARLAIDTYRSAIAKAALEEGVMMVNDVTAGRRDPQIFSMLKDSQALLVLMYSKDPTPRTTIEPKQYDDVVEEVKAFLSERTKRAVKEGIAVGRIVLDPGLGHFVSSDPRYSFEILARLREFSDLGSPIFVSPSRKSFLAGEENLKTADRLPGTIAASALAVLNGAQYIRTHDPLEVRRGCEIALRVREKSE
ncbi:dihydropteroate synthase [Candidatus Peregrinibacteria bacterium]|nr:dihydropteroate synthase [Candidatus Peregrinibacteria bacterium]